MDQLLSEFGKKAHALLIDCRTIDTKAVSVRKGVAVMIINSNLIRTLVGSKPTADYHRNIAWCLHEQGTQCHLVSSASCVMAREMLFKTSDEKVLKDAMVIMYLLEQGLFLPFYHPLANDIIDLNEISNTYHQVTLARPHGMNSLVNHYLILYSRGSAIFFIRPTLSGSVCFYSTFPYHPA